MASSPIGVAIIGSGHFAKEQHLPAVLGCSSLRLKAIFSRSLSSAQEAAKLVPSSSTTPVPDLYAADAGPGREYDDLLGRADIVAFIIALPIVAQPAFVEAALGVGKHVLAEKPIGPDVATAQRLIAFSKSSKASSGATLSVAENFRFVPRLVYARDQARRLGRVTHFSVKVMSLMKPEAKWYRTAWRQTPAYQGGFLLDGGVHHAAAARFIFLAGDENRAVDVRAFSDRVCEHLPPIDSVAAIVRTASCATGTVQLSAGSLMDAFEWDVACERGSVKSAGETVTVRTADGAAPVVEQFDRVSGVPEEVAAWAAGILAGTPDPRQSAEEALADLEFLEKIFRSGEDDGALKQYEFQS
ncbi:oxidoreductase family, NAD-binding Rossmann fold protein [Drechmeria coniospora]|uniref:Oxidoreductase family, NAD-binding Rossmann fold protein n=1 Tax=Drechmeria coniospora TaxID=98403 RepID=A0A151GJM5_DRECN|nr:oxidoreductase family, NAD-binding Rossmann fold protein [Drechmeria coniospora]KYK57333.1 oxidoreductase family, NAD-binding Rossmann fold protein [Drechmeria coniospora]